MKFRSRQTIEVFFFSFRDYLLWLTLGKFNHGIVSTVFDILMLTTVKLIIIYQHDNHVKTISVIYVVEYFCSMCKSNRARVGCYNEDQFS